MRPIPELNVVNFINLMGSPSKNSISNGSTLLLRTFSKALSALDLALKSIRQLKVVMRERRSDPFIHIGIRSISFDSHQVIDIDTQGRGQLFKCVNTPGFLAAFNLCYISLSHTGYGFELFLSHAAMFAPDL